MNYKDFEKYNGRKIKDILHLEKDVYLHDYGTIDGVKVVVEYSELDGCGNVYLINNNVFYTCIGHAFEDDETHDYLFEATDHAWT